MPSPLSTPLPVSTSQKVTQKSAFHGYCWWCLGIGGRYVALRQPEHLHFVSIFLFGIVSKPKYYLKQDEVEP
jgi:hypothetical protein